MLKHQFQQGISGYLVILSHHQPNANLVEAQERNAFPYEVGYFDNKGIPYVPSPNN